MGDGGKGHWQNEGEGRLGEGSVVKQDGRASQAAVIPTSLSSQEQQIAEQRSEETSEISSLSLVRRQVLSLTRVSGAKLPLLRFGHLATLTPPTTD